MASPHSHDGLSEVSRGKRRATYSDDSSSETSDPFFPKRKRMRLDMMSADWVMSSAPWPDAAVQMVRAFMIEKQFWSYEKYSETSVRNFDRLFTKLYRSALKLGWEHAIHDVVLEAKLWSLISKITKQLKRNGTLRKNRDEWVYRGPPDMSAQSSDNDSVELRDAPPQLRLPAEGQVNGSVKLREALRCIRLVEDNDLYEVWSTVCELICIRYSLLHVCRFWSSWMATTLPADLRLVKDDDS
ncbi:MAG: hypothetical protein M1833_000200 [Piccolia ochrophora]|nr:MAG: hypothetical protein M1833_000200 [Piccolia ochrophora]